VQGKILRLIQGSFDVRKFSLPITD